MRILLTGARGMLGTDIALRLGNLDMDFFGIDRDELDITDEQAVFDFFSSNRPDAVIHCAAYTAVDKAESERDIALKVNAGATGFLARAAASADAKIMYISTDYVFDGMSDIPYETHDDCNPINWYGYTKHKGEEAVRINTNRHFIVRISWLFGHNGNNFVKTMMKLAAVRESIDVVNDQFGSPTFTEDLAILLCDMIMTEKYGIYHATNEGFCSWADFAQQIMELTGSTCKINPITTEMYPTKTVRPKNSMLSRAKLDHSGFTRLPEWEDALGRYLTGCNLAQPARN